MWGTRYIEYNKRTDDELSYTVRKAVGDDFYYHGKEKSDSGVVCYEYQIKKKDKEAATDFINALNDAVKNEQGKIRVWVGIEISGGLEPIFYVENFSDDGLKAPDYDGMYAIYIQKPDRASDECFYNPSIYTGIEGIRKLRIDSEMKEKTEKQGIDWYEIWSDLEEVEVAGWDEL